MTNANDRNLDLLAFTEELKARLRNYLAVTDTRQADLADRMGIHHSSISQNMGAGRTMTESFVRKLSEAVPEFADAIVNYFEIKHGFAASSRTRVSAERVRVRAAAQAEVAEATKEVENAVARLSAVVNKLVKQL